MTDGKLLLCIDASAPRSALAVGRVAQDGSAHFLSGDERVDGANQASQTLGQRIRDTLQKADVAMAEVDLIACGCGPGTFTGTRVALATAQGLASGLRRDTVSLSTLDALAWSDPRLDSLEGHTLLALLDARRGEVYARAYTVSGDGCKAITEARCAPLDQVLSELPETPLAALGPGVPPYRELLASRAELIDDDAQPMGPSARGLFLASCAALSTRGAHPVAELRPMYLRATYAELGINKPKRPMYRSPFVERAD